MGEVIKQRSSRKKIRIKVFLLLVALCLLIGGGVFINVQVTRRRDESSLRQCNGDYSSPIYKEIKSALLPSQREELGRVVAKVQTMKNYTTDANCLYPVVAWSIYRGSAIDGRKYYDLLSKVYDKKVGFMKEYEVGTDAYEQLGKSVVYLEKLAASQGGAK